MKRIFVLFVLFVSVAFGPLAHADESIKLARSAVEAERSAMIATNLGLDDAHKDVFWPLYKEYRSAIGAIADDKVAFFQRFFSSYESLTDAEALALLDEHVDFKQRHIDVQKVYAEKMRSVLPGRVVARFFQIENKMDIIVDYEMTGEFPLIK